MSDKIKKTSRKRAPKQSQNRSDTTDPLYDIEIEDFQNSVLIYPIIEAKQPDLPSFVTDNIWDFLAGLQVPVDVNAAFYTIRMGKVLLLVCMVGDYGSDWLDPDKGVRDIRQYLDTTSPFIQPKSEWTFPPQRRRQRDKTKS